MWINLTVDYATVDYATVDYTTVDYTTVDYTTLDYCLSMFQQMFELLVGYRQWSARQPF